MAGRDDVSVVVCQYGTLAYCLQTVCKAAPCFSEDASPFRLQVQKAAAALLGNAICFIQKDLGINAIDTSLLISAQSQQPKTIIASCKVFGFTASRRLLIAS